MPLTRTDALDLVLGVEDLTPGSQHSVVRGPVTFLVSGYLQGAGRVSQLLDSLGLVVTDALMHLYKDELLAGDVIDNRWVVWDQQPKTSYYNYVLRRLLPFQAMTVQVRVEGARVPGTNTVGPSVVTETAILVYILAGPARSVQEEGTEMVRRSVQAVSTTAVPEGAEVVHPTWGNLQVVGCYPYGPWFHLQLVTP